MNKKYLARVTLVALLGVSLSGCETPTTQRYSISAENNIALKSIGATGIGVGNFNPPNSFSSNCRALGPLKVADNMTHTGYIQKAFEDELRVAGIHAATNARVVLSGSVDKLEFSSARALTGGQWTIGLTLRSSNGKQMTVNEYYEFDTGFVATEACRNTAEAYSRAVQNLVAKTVKDPVFVSLVK